MKTPVINVIENHVSKFRQIVGLSDAEAVNLKSLIRKLNVLTVYRDLSLDFSGMSLKSGDYHILSSSRY